MKKVILSVAAALGTMLSASAISPFIEVQPLQVGKGDFTAFNVQVGLMRKVHPNFSVGAGIGVTEQYDFNTSPLIPIFARGQLEGRFGSLSPFFSFDVGYEINTENTDWGAVLVNPMVGVRYGEIYGGIGYLGHCWTPEYSGSTSCFNIKLGYIF